MQFPTILIALFATLAIAAPSSPAGAVDILERAINAGRPVATGACCIADTSKKGDTCKNAKGAAGVCAVADTAGCKYLLDSVFERGRGDD